MKLMLRFLLTGELSELLEGSKDYSEHLFSLGDENYNQLISVAKKNPRFTVHVFEEFSKAQLKTITHFRMIMSKNPVISDRDIDTYFEYLDTLPDTGYKSILPYVKKLFVSKKIIDENKSQIFGLSHFDLPLATKQCKNILIKAKIFDKSEFYDVFDLKHSRKRKDIFFINPKNILEPILKDLSIIKEKCNERSVYRPKGLISYTESQLANVDTALIGETINSNGQVVVSADVVKKLKSLKISGVKFLPILTKESNMYKDYLNCWNKLVSDVDECKGSTIW